MDMILERELYFMRLAIDQAKIAAELGEAPVGAVVCRGEDVVSVGHNRRETGKNALYHAELIAIDEACKKLGGWRLFECGLYVTLEPCPMCAGAVINSRIRRLVFGASDPKAGCFGSLVDFNDIPFNHKPEIVKGVLADECSQLLKDFFADLRTRKS